MSEPAPTVWRYMSFLKFVAMLETHSLWFSRPYTFDDPWDGHSPPAYRRRLRPIYDDDATLDCDLERRFKRRRYGFFVNCWQQGEHECLAMWKLYGASPEGVAIKSTTEAAIHCLHPYDSGMVKYYDPNDDIPNETVFSGSDEILYKRRYFQFEREWRMWRCDDVTLQRLADGRPELDVASLSRGEDCGIEDLDKLVQKLVVAPAASNLLVDTVRKLCIKYGKGRLADRVERSPYDLEPAAFS